MHTQDNPIKIDIFHYIKILPLLLLTWNVFSFVFVASLSLILSLGNGMTQYFRQKNQMLIQSAK